MKKLVTLVLALAMVFSLLSVASAEATETPINYTVGMSVADLSNPIWAEVCDQVEKHGAELGIKIDVVACKNDPTTQIAQVEAFIAQKVDAIIISAVDAASMDEVCQSAMDAGIKVMAYGVNLNYYDVSLTNDNAGAGTLIGEEAAKFIQDNYDGKAEVGLITYYENAECLARGKAMEAALLDACPDAEIVEESSTVVADEAMSIVENWLQAHPDMKVIMSIGDGGGIGADQAVKAAGAADGFGIFAVDGTVEALQLMANGDPIKAEVSFGSGWQLGNQVVDVMYAALTDPDYQKDNVSPNIVVTKDNLTDLITEWNYEDRIDLSKMQ